MSAPKQTVFGSINAGGTNLGVGIFDTKGNKIDQREFPSSGDADHEVPGDFETDITNIVGYLRELEAANHARIKGIGIAAAGTVADDRRSLLNTGKITWWKGVPVVRRLEEAFSDTPIILDNDAKGAGLAEALLNESLEGLEFVYIGVGTGIGGSIIEAVDGKVHARATELGHIRVPAGDRVLVCECGQLDCWEASCSGAGMCRYYKVESSRLLSDTQWDEVVGRMAVGVRNIYMSLFIPRFVFGGGVSVKEQQRRQILDQIANRLDKEVRMTQAPRIIAAKFGGIWSGYALLVHAGIA